MERMYVLFIALTVINIIFFLFRNEAPSYTFSDYSSVYFPNECYIINKIARQHDSVQLSGHFPKKLFYKSVDNKIDYKMTDPSGFHFSCTIEFTPHAVYQSKGNSTQSHIRVIHCSLPIMNTPKFFLQDWIQKNTTSDSVSIHHWLVQYHVLQIGNPIKRIDKLCRSLLDTLHKTNSASLLNKIIGYISPQPIYIFYSFENHLPQIIFYLRDFFLILWILAFSIILVHFLFYKLF